MSRDPLFGSIVNPLSLNPFVYALDNPLLLADPSGLSRNRVTRDPCTDPTNPLSWICGVTAVRTLPFGTIMPMSPPERNILSALEGKLGGDGASYATGGESEPGTQLQITFGRGARHLEGTELNAGEVEAAIAQTIRDSTKDATAVGQFWGRVTVDGQVVEFRAYPVGETHINVGTYYPIQ